MFAFVAFAVFAIGVCTRLVDVFDPFPFRLKRLFGEFETVFVAEKCRAIPRMHACNDRLQSDTLPVYSQPPLIGNEL